MAVNTGNKRHSNCRLKYNELCKKNMIGVNSLGGGEYSDRKGVYQVVANNGRVIGDFKAHCLWDAKRQGLQNMIKNNIL